MLKHVIRGVVFMGYFVNPLFAEDVFDHLKPVQLMNGQEVQVSPTQKLWPMHIDLIPVGIVSTQGELPGQHSQLYVQGRYETGKAIRHPWLPTPHKGTVIGRVNRDGSFVRLVLVLNQVEVLQNAGACFFRVTVLEGKVVKKDGILFLDARHDEKFEAALQEQIDKAMHARLD